MVDWFRRRKNSTSQDEPEQAPQGVANVGEARGETPHEAAALDVETETAGDLIDRTPEPEEPADGFVRSWHPGGVEGRSGPRDRSRPSSP